MSKRKRALEAKLSLKQRKAALMLVEKELDIEGLDIQTDDEIAEACEVHRMTVYRWKNQNVAFRDYMNLIADEYFQAQRTFVYKQLLKTISGEQPSIKGIDLYMKRHGLLTEKHEVTTTNDGPSSNEDLEESLKEVDSLLSNSLPEEDK